MRKKYKRLIPLAMSVFIVASTLTGCNVSKNFEQTLYEQADKLIPGGMIKPDTEKVKEKPEIQAVVNQLQDVTKNSFTFASKESLMFIGSGSIMLESNFIEYDKATNFYIYKNIVDNTIVNNIGNAITNMFANGTTDSTESDNTVSEPTTSSPTTTTAYIIDGRTMQKSDGKNVSDVTTELDCLNILNDCPDLNKFDIEETDDNYVLTLINSPGSYSETINNFAFLTGTPYKSDITTIYIDKKAMAILRTEVTIEFAEENSPSVYYILVKQFIPYDDETEEATTKE